MESTGLKHVVSAGLAIIVSVGMFVSSFATILPKNAIGLCEVEVVVGTDVCILVWNCGTDSCFDVGLPSLGLNRYGCLPPVPPGGSAVFYNGPRFLDCGNTEI